MTQQHHPAGSYSARDVHQYRAQLRMFVEGTLTRTFERREQAETERVEAARAGLQALAAQPDRAFSSAKDRLSDALPPRTYSPATIEEKSEGDGAAPANRDLALAL